MLKRFGIAVDEHLLGRFDKLLADEGYANRSEAVRDLIREALVRREWESDDTLTMGTLVLVYDHHKHDLMSKLTDIQHEVCNLIVASLHTHLDEHNCQEIIVMRGSVAEMKQTAYRLISTNGVKHGHLLPSTTGKEI